MVVRPPQFPQFILTLFAISVTLSYNLFFEDEDTSPMLAVDVVQERIVGRIVSALELPGNFDDSQPFVAFHLQHRYVSPLSDDHSASGS